MSTNPDITDIRLLAWSFGREVGTMTGAYAALEAGNDKAVKVFAALKAGEWGVQAALADGLNGVRIFLPVR